MTKLLLTSLESERPEDQGLDDEMVAVKTAKQVRAMMKRPLGDVTALRLDTIISGRKDGRGGMDRMDTTDASALMRFVTGRMLK